MHLNKCVGMLKEFNPIAIDFNVNSLTDHAIDIIMKNAPGLTRLSLLDNNLTDDGIAALLASDLPLRTLRVSGAGNRAFEGKNKCLEDLYLDSCSVSLEGLRFLSKFTSLTSLQIINTDVDELPDTLVCKLERLRLRNSGITDREIIQIAQSGTKLIQLALEWEKNLGVEGYEALAANKSIKILEISGHPGIPAQTLLTLLQSMNNLIVFVSSSPTELSELNYSKYNKKFRKRVEWGVDPQIL